MKTKRLNGLWLLLFVFVFSAFVIQNGGYIKGKVSPAENAVNAFAIMGTDTIHSKITNGSFEISKLKAGTYQLIIEASGVYKHKLISDIVVKEGEYTNVDEIQLEPK